MTEVTEWNGKPRYMWCWDRCESLTEKQYVVYILTDKEKKETNANYPVITGTSKFLHCAEIEEETTRLTKALETEFEELKAKNKCPCLSDYSTCLAEDKWELAQREIERLKAREKALGERVLQSVKLIDEIDGDMLAQMQGGMK